MKFFLPILALVLLNANHGAEARTRTSRSIDSHLELEEQLKILNKPPIKTFKNHYGENIDCINMYKQPAFDHPLLKTHKLQLRPTALPKGGNLGREDSRLIKVVKKGSKECPPGTVPFKRTTKDDLTRAKAALDAIRPRPTNLMSNFPPNIHYAAVTTPVNPFYGDGFYGAKTSISVFNLTTGPTQISEAFLWIGSNNEGAYSSIEYGWIVHPQLYGDNLSRTYSLWTADGLQNTGCYNAVCPGFVQVSTKRIMGEPNHPVSTYGGDIYAMEFQIFKDPKTTNWWLLENLGDTKNEPVGYWPKELFPDMKDSANMVQLGGKVYAPDGSPSNPQMGSGAFIPDDFTRTCYASNIAFVNSANQFFTPKDVPMNVIQDEPNDYKAAYLGDVSKDHPERGYTLVFGGPDMEQNRN